MAGHEIMKLLRESELFGGVSEFTLKALAALCSTHVLKKDQILFLEGRQGEKVYLLSAGMIQLFKGTEHGKRSLIHLVHPGDLFAEVVLFERETYPVTAIAAQKSQIIAIPKKGFLNLLEDRKVREDFLKHLMYKLRLLTRQIRRLTSDDLEGRFFGFLEDYFGSSQVIEPKMTKKDMAAALGVTPEAFSRFLARLKKQGRLQWEHGKIRKF